MLGEVAQPQGAEAGRRLGGRAPGPADRARLGDGRDTEPTRDGGRDFIALVSLASSAAADSGTAARSWTVPGAGCRCRDRVRAYACADRGSVSEEFTSNGAVRHTRRPDSGLTAAGLAGFRLAQSALAAGPPEITLACRLRPLRHLPHARHRGVAEPWSPWRPWLRASPSSRPTRWPSRTRSTPAATATSSRPVTCVPSPTASWNCSTTRRPAADGRGRREIVTDHDSHRTLAAFEAFHLHAAGHPAATTALPLPTSAMESEHDEHAARSGRR